MYRQMYRLDGYIDGYCEPTNGCMTRWMEDKMNKLMDCMNQ